MGWPIRPASASSLRRSSIQPSSPPVPFSAKRGAWRVELAKRLLPWPPRPPWATTARCPASSRSSEPPSAVSPWVPGGTAISRSSPRAPCRLDPSPWRPFSARKCLLPVSAPRSRRDGSQTSTTSPPCPPSPPSGPPRGTCASRRKLTHPFPPAPPSTNIFARSYIARESSDGQCRPAMRQLTRPEARASGVGPVEGVGCPSERLVLFRRAPSRQPAAIHEKVERGGVPDPSPASPERPRPSGPCGPA